MTDQVKHKLSTLIGVFLQMTIAEQNDEDVWEILDIKGRLKIPHIIKLARELEDEIPNIWVVLSQYVIKTLNDSCDTYVFMNGICPCIGTLETTDDDGNLHFVNVVTENGEKIPNLIFNLPNALRDFNNEMMHYLIEPNDIAEWDYDWENEDDDTLSWQY